MSRVAMFRRQDGAAALEFALVAPFIVMLVWAMVELGGLYNTRITLTHAAREGVRAYALGAGDPAGVVQESVPTAAVTASGCPNPAQGGATATVAATSAITYTLPTFSPPFDFGTETVTITVSGVGRMRCGG